MKIIELNAENVKRLQAVQIKPDGKGGLVVIGGANGAGKSSVLDAIEMVFAGSKAIPAMPIRKGTKKARIVAKLDGEGLVIERSITPKGSYLTVSADGKKYDSPQAMLDKLVGRISFDPLAFMRMKPAEQFTLLKDLLKLDTSDLDRARQEAFDKRTDVGREVKALRARVQAINVPADAPDAEVPAAQIAAELQEAIDTNAAVERSRADLTSLTAQLHETTVQLEQLQRLHQKLADAIKANKDRAETLKMIDLAPLKARMLAADSANAAARAKKERARLEAELAAKELEHDDLDGAISEAEETKKQRIAESKCPVPGLSLEDGTVTLNDIPLDQASSAEQLKVSVAIGLAANPTLKVLLIRDGSLLDADNLERVAQMAADADAQVWIERVGEGKECQVVLEDGAIKEDEAF